MQTIFHWDDGKNLTVEHRQDVEPVLELNKWKRSEEQHSDCSREVADIPNVTLIKWLNEEHARGNHDLKMFTVEFNALVKRKLADPDWAYLRTDRPALIMGWTGS